MISRNGNPTILVSDWGTASSLTTDLSISCYGCLPPSLMESRRLNLFASWVSILAAPDYRQGIPPPGVPEHLGPGSRENHRPPARGLHAFECRRGGDRQ